MDYFILYTLYVLIATVLFGVCAWKLFQKLQEPAWKAFVPFLNYATVLRDTGNPVWWSALSYLPIVGPVMMCVFNVLLARKFGKTKFWEELLAAVLPFIYIGILNYSSNTQVAVPEQEFLLPREQPKKKKESLLGSLTFAVVFATLIHTFITQPFGIPTGSMERTLLVGDFLFVNKLNYGYRMPMRPVGVPFLQGTLWDAGKKGNPKDDPKSYVEAVKLPYFRLPGWEKVEKKDIVVFNYPRDSVHKAFDRADPYVKRCAGVAGDVVEFRKGRLFVNNVQEQPLADQENQYAYVVNSESEIDFNQLYNRYGFLPVKVGMNEDRQYRYIFTGLTPEIAAYIKNLPGVISVEEWVDQPGVKTIAYKVIADSYGRPIPGPDGREQYSKNIDTTNTIFPVNQNWNSDFWGPVRIPRKGDVIKLTQENLPMYQWIISRYEGHNLESKNGQFFIDGKPSNSYTLKYDYYLMIGDNRDASLDSRFFGFVPETHIIGKPMFSWLSLQGAFPDERSSIQAPFKVRFDRMFKAANTGEKQKTSYWWLAAIVLVLFFGWEFFVKLFKKKK